MVVLISLSKLMAQTAAAEVTLIAILLALCEVLCGVREQCTESKYSIQQMMLRQHTFKILKTSNSFEWLVACEDDDICQSFNYVTTQDICELNNRTREARPADFVPNFIRYYYGRVNNRGEFLLPPSRGCCYRCNFSLLSLRDFLQFRIANKGLCKAIRSRPSLRKLKGVKVLAMAKSPFSTIELY